MIKSNEDPRCPVCGGKLEKKGWVDRVRKYAGGKKAWMKIECRRCTRKECGRSHRLLPAGSTPFKHYLNPANESEKIQPRAEQDDDAA